MVQSTSMLAYHFIPVGVFVGVDDGDLVGRTVGDKVSPTLVGELLVGDVGAFVGLGVGCWVLADFVVPMRVIYVFAIIGLY